MEKERVLPCTLSGDGVCYACLCVRVSVVCVRETAVVPQWLIGMGRCGRTLDWH